MCTRRDVQQTRFPFSIQVWYPVFQPTPVVRFVAKPWHWKMENAMWTSTIQANRYCKVIPGIFNLKSHGNQKTKLNQLCVTSPVACPTIMIFSLGLQLLGYVRGRSPFSQQYQGENGQRIAWIKVKIHKLIQKKHRQSQQIESRISSTKERTGPQNEPKDKKITRWVFK